MGLTRIRAGQISNLDFKQAVRVVTTTNITLSGGATNTVDSVVLSVSDRVLVTAQATASQNGLYEISVLGSGSNGTWVRTLDGNNTGDMSAGMMVTVTEGTAYKDTQWQLTTNNPIVLGTTTLTFEQIVSGGGSYTAGTGLTLTGSQFSVNNAQSQITSVGTLSTLSVSGTITSASVVGGVITGSSSSVSGIVTGASVVGGVITGANVSVTGNITGSYILGNGSQLTGIAGSYGNADVVANLAALGSNPISTTGNITGGNVISNGARVYKWTTVANTAPSNAVPGDNWYDSYADKKYQYTNDGTSNIWIDQSFPTTYANLTITGNVTSGNLLTSGVTSATGNITGGNLVTAGAITGASSSVTGNITGGNVLTGGLISATSNIISAANVTGGNITTGGLILATGNITSGASLNTVNLSLSGNVLGNLLPSANITYNLGSTTQRWNTLFLAGNTIDLGIQTISASESGVSMGTGNLSGGNILTSGLISATGNISADDIYANSYTVGTSYNISAYSATTASSASDQEIYSIAPGNISSIDFKIIAYCIIDNTKTTTFITTTILSSTLVWAEYGRLNINSGIGTLSVAYIGVSPMIKLLATPSSSNLTYYNLIISIYN